MQNVNLVGTAYCNQTAPFLCNQIKSHPTSPQFDYMTGALKAAVEKLGAFSTSSHRGACM